MRPSGPTQIQCTANPAWYFHLSRYCFKDALHRTKYGQARVHKVEPILRKCCCEQSISNCNTSETTRSRRQHSSGRVNASTVHVVVRVHLVLLWERCHCCCDTCKTPCIMVDCCIVLTDTAKI